MRCVIKIAMTADSQCDNYSDYSKVLPDGMNSRLKNIIGTFEQMHEYCVKNNIKVFVINGDIFNSRDRIKVDVYLAMYKMIEKFNNSKIAVYINLGNHDIIEENTDVFALYPFSGIAKVIKTYGSYDHNENIDGELKKTRIGFIAYSDHMENIKNAIDKMIHDKCDLLFMHCGVNGAAVGPNDFILKSQLIIDDLHPNKFDYIFLGHYHKFQHLIKNVMYIGSPLQLDFGERNDKKGFVVYDIESKNIEFIPTEAPMFLEVDYDKIDSYDIKDNFIKIRTSEKPMKIYDDIMYRGAAYCIIMKDNKDIKNEKRLDVDMTTSLEDMMKKYIDHLKPENIDNEILLELGREMLNETKKS